jgi:single-strand DNA-binding protein
MGIFAPALTPLKFFGSSRKKRPWAGERSPLALGSPQHTEGRKVAKHHVSESPLHHRLRRKRREHKFTTNGTPVTVLSVATKASWKNKETGEWESRTEWHRIVCWSKLAEFAGSLKSGAHVQVEGELRSRKYEKEGITQRIWECKASRIDKLDRIERADDRTSADEPTHDQPPF